MDRESETPIAGRKELPKMQEADSAYINSIYEQIVSDEHKFVFNTKIELLRETAEIYLNPKSDSLQGNAGIFFNRYTKELDALLRKANVEVSIKESPHDIGSIATRIGKIYEDLADFKPKAVFAIKK